MMKLIKRIPLTLGIGTTLVCSGASHAQTTTSAAESNSLELEEIVVTAERREADVQKTAASLEVRRGQDLLQQGKFNLQQILEGISNVTVTTGNGPTDSPGSDIVIRGAVPNGAAAGDTSVPTTALYVDGIYSGSGGNYDINRVEVLRGPQGTLYGRSATSGVVATYTNNPEIGKLSADITGEYGSYDLVHGTAVINAPLGDTLALRVAGNYFSRNGYLSDSGGWTKSNDGKAKLLYKPNDDFSILLGAALQNNTVHTGGVSLSQSSPDVVVESSAPIASGKNQFRQYWSEINWNLGPATLTYLPSYRTWLQDNPQILAGPGGITLKQVQETPTDKFMTHEIRLASNAGSGITWQVGGLYYKNELRDHQTGVVIYSTNAPVFFAQSSKATTDIGAFGEATLPLGDSTWRLTAGLRYDYTKVDGTEDYTVASNPFGFAPEPNVTTSSSIQNDEGLKTFNNVTYKLRMEKDVTDANMVYAVISTGFLPGDVQVTTVNKPDVNDIDNDGNVTELQTVAGAIEYDQEKLTAFEVGSKNRFMNNQLQLNGAAFYYDYTGFQTSANISLSNPSFAILTTPAKMYGVELDGVFQLTANDRVGLSAAYLNARYVDKTALFASYIWNDKIPGISPITASANYEHNFRLGNGSNLSFHADARYGSSYVSQNLLIDAVNLGAKPYSTVDNQVIGNLSTTWKSPNDRYSVTGYVRNVADNDYKSGGGSSAYNATSVTSATASQYDPRTWGVVLQASF